MRKRGLRGLGCAGLQVWSVRYAVCGIRRALHPDDSEDEAEPEQAPPEAATSKSEPSPADAAAGNSVVRAAFTSPGAIPRDTFSHATSWASSWPGIFRTVCGRTREDLRAKQRSPGRLWLDGQNANFPRRARRHHPESDRPKGEISFTVAGRALKNTLSTADLDALIEGNRSVTWGGIIRALSSF